MWYVDLDRNFVLQKLYDDVPELTKIEIGAIRECWKKNFHSF
jgi:hypothetical protein